MSHYRLALKLLQRDRWPRVRLGWLNWRFGLDTERFGLDTERFELDAERFERLGGQEDLPIYASRSVQDSVELVSPLAAVQYAHLQPWTP